MSIEISSLDRSGMQRRTVGKQISDIVDYPFQILRGNEKRNVAVGITGQFHDPAEALGSKTLSQDESVQAAQDFLRFVIDKGKYDPFKPDAVTLLDLPPAVMDYWVEHREIPHWL